MKFFKRVLTIILIVAIIYMGYHVYLTLRENNLSLDPSMILGTYNEVIDINTNSTTSSTPNISLSQSTTSTSINHFYYNQLDSNAKIIYAKLEENISNLKKTNYTIDFSTQFNSLLNQTGGNEKLGSSFQSAIDAFFYDHPELFYIDLTKISLLTRSQTIGTRTTYYVSIVPKDNQNYLYSQFSSQTQLEQAINQVESIRNSFLNGVSGDTYHQILQVHDTLVNLMEYDTTYNRTNTHNIYGALVEKSVVCEGYAKSFKYILDALNIPCILVSGTATNSAGNTESHMWNYVQINGVWYGVDVTWDDPIIIGGFNRSTISHDYLCKGSITFNESHIISNRLSDTGMAFSYPELNIYDYQ